MDQLTMNAESANIRWMFAKHRIDCNCSVCRDLWHLAESVGRGFDQDKLHSAMGEPDELDTAGGVMSEVLREDMS